MKLLLMRAFARENKFDHDAGLQRALAISACLAAVLMAGVALIALGLA